MATTLRAEKTPFRQMHLGAAESITTKTLRAQVAEMGTLRTNSIIDTDGDAGFSLSSRRLRETASQTASGLGADGVLWVRSADSKLIYTNAADADADVTDVGIGAVLARGNDAGDNGLLNLHSIAFSGGVMIGVGSTTQSGGVAIGETAVTDTGNNIALGHSTTNSGVRAVVAGYASSAVTAASVDGGVVLGSQSIVHGENIAIGAALDASAITGTGAVLIMNSATPSNFMTQDMVVIGDWIGGDTPEAESSVVIGCTNGPTGVLTDAVLLGHGASTLEQTTNGYCVALGSEALASHRGVTIGASSAADGTDLNTLIGLGGSATANTSVCIGAAALSEGANQVVCGSSLDGVTNRNIASAAGIGSTIIGQGNESNHANCVLLGSDLTSSVASEFRIAGVSRVGGSLSAAIHTSALVASFPLSVAGSVVLVSAHATAITGSNDTATLRFSNYHFRNIGGTASFLSNIETSATSDPDAVGGFSGTLALNANTIEFRVTCTTAAAFNGLLVVRCL